MSIQLKDPALLAEFLAIQEWAEVTDSTGKVIGRFSPAQRGELPPGFKIPYSPEQMAEFRKSTGGRHLSDILRDLETRG